MPRILNFGSLNLDYVYSVEHFVRAGETISSSEMKVFCGGKGLNQSIALARAGASVCHAGFVGADDGKELIKILEQSGVNVDLIERCSGYSGHAIIQVDANGQNCILLCGGANQTNSKEYIKHVLSGFDSGDFVLLQNEINYVDEIIIQAKAKCMKVILNPSPMDEKIMRMPLKLVDYFVLNETEAAGLCGVRPASETSGELINALTKKFPEASILLTLGGNGAVFAQLGQKIITQGVFPAKVVDTTGAGDTFTGYFFANFIGGCSVTQSLRIATAAAAIAVSKEGAAIAVPTAAQVEEFLRNAK